MEQRYVLGLDIGIASVGWAALALNDKDEPYRILDMNSRIFPEAEQAKSGESLASPRRKARGMRRRLRRRRHRLDRLRSLLVREGVLDKAALAALYEKPMTDIYAVRCEGLERKLTSDEWARVLLYFTKHRGFKSNRLAEAENDDEGQVKDALKANAELLTCYRTVGEMLYKDVKFQAHKRNKAADYQMTVSRDMLLSEIKQLFAAQRAWNNKHASETFEEKYVHIFSSQRNFDEGPGGNSPYGGNLIERMIGVCTLERAAGEKRAPKASFSFMRFTLLEKLSHIRITANGITRSLTNEERRQLEQLAWQSPSLTYAHLRKALGLQESERFNDLYYTKDYIETEKKKKFGFVAAYHEVRKALDKLEKDYIKKLSQDELDVIGYAFSVFKNEGNLHSYLINNGIAEEVCSILLANLKPFRKFGHISIKACRNIIPYLEQGMTYDAACRATGYEPSGYNGSRQKILSGAMEEVREIPNPVVRRSISQTIKVLNALIRRYGSPVEIHVELAREMARSFQDRKEMQNKIENNRKANERIIQELRENGLLQPNGLDIVKWKLYKEQQGVCAYSQKPFDVERLLHDGKYAEVDHILPYSRSFDDSYANKVLVLAGENRHKGNHTPLEYMAGKEEKLNAFVCWVNTFIRDLRKRQNLLRKNFHSEENEWKDRHLNDTKYISRFVYNLLRQHLEFSTFMSERKRHVLAVNGSVTAYVRKRLGINKIRANGDLHHAVDAVIIACVTQGMVNIIEQYSKARELWDISAKEPFPEPWPGFRKELEARTSDSPADNLRRMHLENYTEEELQAVKPIFVSRMPRRKVRAAAHEETIRSAKHLNEGVAVVKKKLSDLKLTKDKTAIEGYFNPTSDTLLYQALLARLQAFNGNAPKAFAEPFYKPRADGTTGPLVRTVKIASKSVLQVGVNGGRGVADNDSMVRVDIFYRAEGKGKGYYLVPVYAADTVKEELPLKAVTRNKSYVDWVVMKPEEFKFSLYKDDLLLVSSAKEMDMKVNEKRGEITTLPPIFRTREVLTYYQGTDSSTASLTVCNHDNTYTKRGMGVKTIGKLKKMQVDVLGQVSEAPLEQRHGFGQMKKDPHRRRGQYVSASYD
ncbi:type II CRISPR RNA-guided endonuclease Cas9 [Selenomonas sp. AE3005]|uniref:type II CRISPR RNA-guided endonuclease Cas9 n=1 Tax=Selenomonas sp. AE3005 TaxID=1485543 RepID=UPI00055B8F74|nr:type II CRISPR RNA-guided endonuclease Cas9 [Selenomonas sp. AE3005]